MICAHTLLDVFAVSNFVACGVSLWLFACCLISCFVVWILGLFDFLVFGCKSSDWVLCARRGTTALGAAGGDPGGDRLDCAHHFSSCLGPQKVQMVLSSAPARTSRSW